MIIKRQPFPKVPPISFFEPISVDPRDMMTDVEYLLGILKKLNLMIAQLNTNTAFIEEYSGKIEEIEKEIKDLRDEMTDFEAEITQDIADTFKSIKLELQSAIATTLIQANAYTDATASVLRNEIREVSLGQITLFDPTTGTMNNLQVVIDNIYNTSREEALTATEYDALQLTATAYDNYELTAFNYDRYGKTLLT